MARETINIGVVANDGTGDTFRIAGQKINNNFAELYTNFEATELGDGIELTGNDIIATRSNDDINLVPAGTGSVTMNSLTIDNKINITDNVIQTIVSNADLVIQPSGTGALRVDYISISDNQVRTNASNADLELSASGTGTVVLNSLSFPTADGTANQVLKTDGTGNLGWATVAAPSFTHITNTDGTATITGSAVTNIDAFSATTYRSAKYSVSMWDSTNSRSGIQDFFVTHDGSTAYITTMGVTSTGSDMATFTADISGGNVRVRATLASGDGTVFKFSKILFLV